MPVSVFNLDAPQLRRVSRFEILDLRFTPQMQSRSLNKSQKF